jgi:hypothetical protein
MLALLWSRLLAHSTGRWLALAGLVGVVCGVVGFLFNLAINACMSAAIGLAVGYIPPLHGPGPHEKWQSCDSTATYEVAPVQRKRAPKHGKST